MLQVDIGQGWKPPGHYVQRSCGLFPAPYPQNSPQIEELCRLFELLGIFIAKCIQDKRRVDLPLSRPLFKLMTGASQACHPLAEEPGPPGNNGGHEGAGGGAESEPATTGETLTRPGDNQRAPVEQNEVEMNNWRVVGDVGREDSSNRGTSHVVVVGPRGGEAQAASSKEAEVLGEGAEEEITKDCGGEKEELLVLEELGETGGGGGGGGGGEGEAPWFQGILQMEDLEKVNPHR